MSKLNNILESVEFLAEEDLLVAELDKRLSFTALPVEGNTKACPGNSICDCLLQVTCSKNQGSGCNFASAVRG